MARVKKNTRVKVKQERKKVSTIMPRLRLEPRLTPKPTKKNKNNPGQETEESSRFFEANEIGGSSSQEKTSYEEELCVDIKNYKEQMREAFDEINNSDLEAPITYEPVKDEVESSERSYEIDENSYDEEMTMKKKQRKRVKTAVRKSVSWNDRELTDLAIGLQTHGLADIKKIADSVQTKNENEISHFMKSRCLEARKTKNTGKQHGRPVNKWTTLCRTHLSSWANVRKWRRLAYEQMLLYTRSKDYSKTVILDLCKKFYEEEEEPADPQVINVKLIYKYMMDCMAEKIPPQLPPKESYLVLHLLEEMRLMPIAYDFEEERKFLQDFKTATNFKPFQVKDEFKKRYKKEEPEDMFDSNAVSVTEDVFLDLSRHKRLIQSFNPLVTPVWMLHKEQEYLEKYVEESKVCVD